MIDGVVRGGRWDGIWDSIVAVKHACVLEKTSFDPCRATLIRMFNKDDLWVQLISI
jgi:hypothetical protein